MKNNFSRLLLACVFVFVLAVTFAFSAFALTSYTNTTYSTNYFYGDTDKDPMTYAVGETMTFTVSLKSSSGDLVSVPYFSYSFSGDDGVSSSGKVSGAAGTLTVTHKITCPGFVRLTVKALDSEGNELSYLSGTDTKYVRFQGGACAEWEKIETAMAEPDDFDEYWERTLAELDAVYPSIYDLKKDTTNSDANYTVYDLYVNAPGSKNFLNTAADGEEPNGATYMAGKLTIPNNIEAGEAKFKLGFQGAGVYTSPGISKTAGYVTLNVYAHSIELSRESSYYTDLNSGLLNGYMRRALYNDNAEESYTKYMILRDLQAVRFLKAFFGEGGDVDTFNEIDVSAWKGLWNGKDIEVSGQSQGGFQAIAVAALDHDISLCTPLVPCWCDMYSRTYFSTRRMMSLVYEHYSQKYFDSVALGKRIVCKTYVSTGFGDDTCPATGVVAAYNAMTCEKQLFIYQGMEHQVVTTYASGVAKQKYSSEYENFKIPFNRTFTFDYEIASVDGDAFELLSDGKTVKAVSMGTATVTFADGNHYPIVVETEAATYDLILSDTALDQDVIDGFAKSIYARTTHTAYAGSSWADFSSEIGSGNAVKGRTYYVISNFEGTASYTADEMYQLYESSGADYLIMIPGASIDATDIAMYAMQLQPEVYPNAYVCADGELTSYQAGRDAGNNIVSIIEKNKPVLDADYKIYKLGGEELKTLSVLASGETLSFAVIPNNLYNISDVSISVSGLEFDKNSMTITGDSDGGYVYINSNKYTVYASAVASGNEDGYSWLIDNDGKLTVLSEGEISDESYPWESYASEITEIEITVGVTKVASGAFAGVTNLTKLTLPYTLTEIADDAVSSASSYTVYGYESNAASVAFAENNGLVFSSLGACGYAGTSLMWEYKDGVLYITGNGTTVESGCEGYLKESTSAWYSYYKNITKVVVCDSVTTIGTYCFYNMDALTEIELTSNVKTIKSNAFMASDNISSIYIRGNEPEAGVLDLSCVTSFIGGYQFDSGAKYATKLILSDDLTGTIGDKFFTTNSKLTELTIPAGVTSLANRSISGNSALKKLTILGKDTAIGAEALVYSASSSTKLDVIYGVIGSPAETFAKNNNIEFVDLTGDKYDGEVVINGECGIDVYFKLVENDTADTYILYFYGTGTEIVSGNSASSLNAPWAAYGDKITNVVYRGSIASMGSYNLAGLSSLESIELDGCDFTDICENAFAGAGVSGAFEIPEEVTEIDANAFAGLSGLDTVIICNPETVIDDAAFEGCVISTVYGFYNSTAETFASSIGATFKNINEYLPVATGYLYATWNGSPTVNTRWYYDKATKTLSFESLAAAGAWNECGNTSYGTDNKVAWSIFKNEIEKVIIGPGLKKVSNNAFKGYTALKVVELTSEVGQIDASAFYNCTSLDTIYIAGNVPVEGIADLHHVATLDSQASVFVGCAFDKVIFNSSETAIKDGSFANSAVTTVIGNSTTTETLATSIGADVVTGYSQSGMIWTLDGATLTVYAGATPTAVSAWSDYAETVTKIVFETESDISTLNTGIFDVFTALEEVLFKCDAPESVAASCFGTNNITVYYAEGTSGFTTPTWNGYSCLEEGSTLELVASGLCKEGGYTWALDDLGTLTISGEGDGTLSFTENPDWNTLDRIPWNKYSDSIKKVVIEEETKITMVAAYGLSNMKNCTTIIIPTTLTNLGEYNVLCNMYNLSTVAVQGNEVIEGVIDLRNVTSFNSQLFEASFKNVKPTIYLPANPTISIVKWGAGCGEMTVVTYPTSTTATLIRKLAKQQAGAAPSAYLPTKITLKYYTAEQDATLVRSGSQVADYVAFDWEFDEATGTLTFTKPANAMSWNELCFNSYAYAKPFLDWMAIWKDAVIHVNVASSFSKFQINGGIASPFKNAFNLISFKFSGNSSLEFQFSGSGGFFEGCESLTTFGFSSSFNEGVIDLSGISSYSGDGANSSMFKGCTSITCVKMRSSAPNAAATGVTNHTWITNSMFSGCTALRSIEIPAWVTKIDSNAFAGCTSLKNVTLNGLPEIAALSAFPDNEGQALIIKCPDQATADTINALGYTYTKAVYIDLGNFNSAITMEGYAVRLRTYNGLRGLFSFDNSVITTNKDYGFTLVEYGALFASQASYNKYGVDLTLDNGVYTTPSSAIAKRVVYAGGEIVGNTLNTSTEEFTKFAASIINFSSNFKTNVYICGYEIWEDASGERIIVYTDFEDDSYDFTNIYQISLNLYRDGYVNAENDEGIVWDILSANGAVTLVAGTDYTYNEGQTDLDGNSLETKFVFRDVPAVYQSGSITFTKSDLTITLLEDGDNYVAVYRGEGVVPGANAWSKVRSPQLSSNFCDTLVLSKVPNPKMAASAAAKIKAIVLDYGVTEVQSAGFSQISSFEKLVYSTSLKKLGGTMFVSCGALNTAYCADVTDPNFVPKSNVVDFSGLTSVDAGYMFVSAKKIQYVRLPANIGTGAKGIFNNDSLLKAVSCGTAELVDGVIDFSQTSLTSFGDYSFATVSNITTLKLPETITTFFDLSGTTERHAFASSSSNGTSACGIRTIITENEVKDISDYITNYGEAMKLTYTWTNQE